MTDLAFGIRGRETRPQMLQVASPNDTVVMVVFDMRVGEARGIVNLCLPAARRNDATPLRAGAGTATPRAEPRAERAWLLENLSACR